MRFLFRLICHVVTLMAWSGIAWVPAARAQQAQSTVPSDPVPAVQIRAAPGIDDSASKSTVSQAQLERFGDGNLLDALRHTPMLTTNGGIRINGNGGATARILVDGQPAPPGFSLDNLPISAVQRIEIYRIGTAELGGSGTGGVLNVVMARYSGKDERRTTLSAGAIGGVPNEAANLLVSQRKAGVDLTLSGAATRGRTPSSSREADQQLATDNSRLSFYEAVGATQSDYRSISLLPRLQWHAANGDRLSAQFMVAHSLRSVANDVQIFQSVGNDFPYAHEASRQRQTTDALSGFLNWTNHLAGGYVTELISNLSSSSASGLDSFAGWDHGDQPLLSREQTQHSQNQRLRSAAKLRLPVDGGHAPVGGVEFDIARERRERMVTDAGVLAQDTTDAYGDTAVRTERLALFAQDEWSLTPNSSIYLGMRWEQIDITSAGSAAASIDKRAGVVSPMLEGLWKLDSKRRLHWALARSYELPPTGLLIARPHLSTFNSPTMPDMAGNPNLRPSLVWQLNGGYQAEDINGQTYSLNSHWRHVDGALEQAVTLQGQRWVSMPVNDHSADGYGVDADWNWKLHEVWLRAPDIEFRTSVAFNWSHVHEMAGRDNRLSGEIPFIVRAGADYRSADGRFGVGIDSNFERGTTSSQGIGQTLTTGSSRSFSAYARLRSSMRDQFLLSVSNLWQLGAVSESRAVVAEESQIQHMLLMSPVQVRLSWEHRFD